jgi:hypothetical protein
MQRFTVTLVAVACLCSLFTFAQAQSAANLPNKYVWWETVQIKGGQQDLFSKLVAQVRDAAPTVAPDFYWIAGAPITGEEGRVTFVTFHDNMASVEKMMATFDKMDAAIALKNANYMTQAAEAEAGAHWALAEYSKELSYRPDLVPLSNTTWWASSLLTLKPGCEYEFAEVVKQVADVHKKAGDNDHWTGYEIRGGYPEPAVLFVTTLRSLADLDQEPPAAQKEMFESAPMRQMFQKIGKECIVHIESAYTRVDPKLSRMPQSMIAANPDFWTIKEEAPAVAPKKGKPKQPAAAPPAPKEPEKK